MKQQVKPKNIIAFLALLLLIIGFPAMSWYYLKKGAEIRISTIKELQMIKPKLDLTFVNSDSTTIQCDTTIKKVKVLIDLDNMNADLNGEWNKLDQQFKDSEEILLYFFTDSQTKPQSFSKQSFYLRKNKTYHALFDTIQSSVMLLDVDNNLRHISKNITTNDFKELVLLTATLIPAKKTPKTKLIRESEK